MADLIVGRSEGIVYPNNNLIYGQFTKEKSSPNDKIIKGGEDNKMILNLNRLGFIDKRVSEIKQAKTDKEIKIILHNIYITTQMDSSIRAEFDDWYNSL
jgi:hypothetical protein